MTFFVLTLVFCGLALLSLAVLQGMRIRAGGQFSTNFVVLFGIIVVATLVAVLAFAPLDNGARSAAFALFGTLVGYLVSRKAPDDPKAPGVGKKRGAGKGPNEGKEEPAADNEGKEEPAADEASEADTEIDRDPGSEASSE